MLNLAWSKSETEIPSDVVGELVFSGICTIIFKEQGKLSIVDIG